MFSRKSESQGQLEIPKFLDLTLGEYSESELPKQISEAEDISYLSRDVLESASFDTNFHWPEILPEGFDPEKLIEEDKNPGLGVRELHKEGVTGKGVTVAAIDQKIDPAHIEFKDNLICNKEYRDGKPERIEETTSMHGPAVASLLAGKNCGVAPDANLYYCAAMTDENNFFGYIRSLEEIIKYNETNEQKVRVVSVSKGSQKVPGLKEWLEIKEKAKAVGITVVDSAYFKDNSITGGGSKGDKEEFDDYDLDLWREGKAPSKKEGRDGVIITPSDFRTMASRQGNDEYRHDAQGGWSWAIPYFSGVLALALQVKPDLENEEFLEIVRKTVGRNKNGVAVINPKGIIEEVKKRVLENSKK